MGRGERTTIVAQCIPISYFKIESKQATYVVHSLLDVVDVAGLDSVWRKEHGQLGHNDAVSQRSLELRGRRQLDLQAGLNPSA
jgi:hypothetical protein